MEVVLIRGAKGMIHISLICFLISKLHLFSHPYLLHTNSRDDEVIELPILEETPLESIASDTKESLTLEFFSEQCKGG